MFEFSNKNALIALAQYLKTNQYQFVTPTPTSHARVLQRGSLPITPSLRDIFGWNIDFSLNTIEPVLADLMQQAGVLIASNHLVKSNVRFSSLGQHLFVHSKYPTTDADAVFFGPDSYRFARLLKQTIVNLPFKNYKTVVDIGCGSGIGGIMAVEYLDNLPKQIILTDINPKALAFASFNAQLANIQGVSLVKSDLYAKIKTPVDLIISNPPYLIDQKARAYRHGGGEYGSLLSTRIVEEGLPLLAANGAMILYTASAIVDGHNTFFNSLKTIMQNKAYQFEFEEIDPDVFGEELLLPEYQKADRIAVVSLVVMNKNNH